MKNLYIPIRVIYADDHKLMHEGLNAVIKMQEDIELVGEALNGEHLINLTRSLQPDVVITDINMPGVNGIEATKKILKEFPHIGIIGFSMCDEESKIIDMLKAGAKGYILKSSAPEEILRSIKCVHKGESFYCRYTQSILCNVRTKNAMENTCTPVVFSEKEKTIIRMICEEYSSSEIGKFLEMSDRTVEGYRLRLLNRINAKNTAGIVLYAIKNNIYEFKN